MSKELLREFRMTSWRSPAEVDDFIQRSGLCDHATLLEMLATILDRRTQAEPRPHALRCTVFARICEAAQAREMFVPIVRALGTADPVAVKVLVELLPKINNVGGHSEVVRLFEHPQQSVRLIALQVITKIGGKTAFGMLAQNAAQVRYVGRSEAIEALVGMAGYHAIAPIKTIIPFALGDERKRILELLASPDFVAKNQAGVVEAVALLLGDASDAVSLDALRTFARVATEAQFIEFVAPKLSTAGLEAIKAIIDGLANFSSRRALDLLAEQLQLGPKSIRLKVLDALEQIGTEDALPVIAEALNHRQIAVRLRAAEVLRNLSGRGKLDIARTILWLLRSRDVQIKRIAADVARSVNDAEGKLWPQLIGYLRDEDWWVRERITDALVEMAGAQLTRHAVSYLQDASDVVRRYGVELLMRIRDPASLGALVRAATGDADWWVRERAVEAIGTLGDARAVPYIVDLMKRDPELRIVSLETLRRLGDRTAAPHVGALLLEEIADPWHTLEILKTLETLNDPNQARVIAPCAESHDHRVRALSRELLRRWNLDNQLREWQGVGAGLSTLDRLLFATAKASGDDLLLAAGRKPYIKRMGSIIPLANNTFTDEQVRGLLLPLLSPAHRESLDKLRDADFSYEVKTEGLRFRANVFQSQSGLSAVFRIVKNVIPAMEELGLPQVIQRFGDLPNGLVLIGGPTGSGKSTTLAALIDYINRVYARHIVTLEDPIEVIHTTKKSLINQREIGQHTRSFHDALRSTLREDPDVILVGEMRDLATIQFAISAAETGHLVFGTVHTASADTTVDRLINTFPAGTQPQVRSILASSLRAVCCQYLAPRKDGSGRIPCIEIMINSDAVANLIRKGKAFQIPNVISTSREMGMQTMDQELQRLMRNSIISSDTAYMRAVNKKEMETFIAEFEGKGSRVADRVANVSGGQPAVGGGH
jgi:twitching motility protein PilT